jgi:cell division septation protein DedD
MHSLVNELADRLDLQPKEAEAVVSGLLIRIRAALETVGEIEVEDLGTFRSVDDQVTFEPAPGFEAELNKEFAGMKPVALTATGESVDVDDRRAIPGTNSPDHQAAEKTDEPVDTADTTTAQEAAESAPDDESEAQPKDVEDLAEEPIEEEATSSFTSPPPPRPSKIRVPPSERRSRSSGEQKPAAATDDGFPDMGSVVSTRPVEPIAANARTKRRSRSKAPVFVVAAVIVGGLLSWLILGGEEETDSGGQAGSESVQMTSEAEQVPVERITEASSETPLPDEEEAEPVSSSTEPEEVGGTTAGTDSIVEMTDSVAQTVTEPEVAAEPEPAPVAAEESRPPATGSAYSWIVASYPSRDEAQHRVEALVESGYRAQVYEATVSGRPAFRVGIGRFVSEAEALRQRERVPPESTDAWVTRVN